MVPALFCTQTQGWATKLAAPCADMLQPQLVAKLRLQMIATGHSKFPD